MHNGEHIAIGHQAANKRVVLFDRSVGNVPKRRREVLIGFASLLQKGQDARDIICGCMAYGHRLSPSRQRLARVFCTSSSCPKRITPSSSLATQTSVPQAISLNFIYSLYAGPDDPTQIYKPSHLRTAASTTASWSDESAPSFLNNFACGIVTRFWASKTPARRKRVAISTSNRESRGLVVCATIVTSARSSSATGMLRTRQGLTFATYPRSTNYTSPRCGLLMRGLVPVEFEKEFLCA